MMFYIYFIYCYLKRPIPRTGVHNKTNPGESECVFTLIYPNGITASLVENITVYTVAIGNACHSSQSTSSSCCSVWCCTRRQHTRRPKRIPYGVYREENCADLLIVCCFSDTNVAGLDNYVALKLDLRTVGVNGYYVPASHYSQSFGLWDQRGFLNLMWQI